jgi:phospholipid-binding lipoprotein MlaA
MPVRLLHLTTALLAAAALTACAGRKPPKPDYDPWEPMNRKIFWFNDKADQYVLEPVAKGWNWAVPERAQRCVTNFFNNLRFPIVFVNDLLQAKPWKAVQAFERFQTNTILGGLGLFDVAADVYGLPLQDEDTGQTFGVWDIAPGPYLVLPLLGPSSPRDAVGLVGDAGLTFYTYFLPSYVSIGGYAINVINYRARYLDTIARAKEASLDYYTFVRNAYVQRRWRQVNDEATTMGAEQEEELYNVEPYENYLQGDTTR